MYASFAPATWALLAYLFGALALCLLMLGLGRVLGGRSHGRAKNLPFESGVDSTGSSRLRFSVKYALVAMLFVIFGIEMPFLYLWAVSLRENGWAGFVEATLFVSLLLVGLFYLHRVGALDWSPERRRKSRTTSRGGSPAGSGRLARRWRRSPRGRRRSPGGRRVADGTFARRNPPAAHLDQPQALPVGPAAPAGIVEAGVRRDLHFHHLAAAARSRAPTWRRR